MAKRVVDASLYGKKTTFSKITNLISLLSVVGIVLYIVITWKNINYLTHQERDVELTSIKLALSVSFAIQFFVLLYGMTGNPIYDSTFCFYAVAVAINISFTSNMRGRI